MLIMSRDVRRGQSHKWIDISYTGSNTEHGERETRYNVTERIQREEEYKKSGKSIQ